MPITSAILEVAERDPEQLAIVGDRSRLTYGELVERSRRTFAVIDELHGAQANPPRPAPETGGIPISAISVESAFAAARFVAALAGYRAVSATIDPRWPLEHRVHVVLATGIGVIITDAAADADTDPATATYPATNSDLGSALAARGWGGTIVSLAEFEERERAVHPAPPPAVRDSATESDEAFLLLFSSGTTSSPKAFLKTRAQYRANVAVSSAHLEPLPGVATFAPGPVSYSLTLYAVIECLATGGSVHVADAFDPFGVAARIRDEAITRIVAVPAVVQTLTDAARRDPAACAGIELVVTGGANLPAAIREGLARVLPDARLISYYGAAEIGFIGDSRDGDGTGISVYPGVEASVRDAAGSPVPAGEPGTLYIRAEACSTGYVAGTTDEVLRGADGWATVHDQARIVGGRLQLLGRAGDIAITGGHKVSLPEVERAFVDMPGVAAACAVALPHATLGSVVALVIEAGPLDAQDPQTPQDPQTAQDPQTPDRAALAAWAAARLAPQFVPRRWYRVERLPRTVGGKLRRGETAELALSPAAVRL
ncbi:class I adenylate-forming enzyme family protein [Leucobacter sp. NPDC058333]|uniref:class I adenylate-forming enzyme family protein n=1 Tax=Leucobacter sp. NPDC058333 TaxID=3346450 RepID=UPI00366A278F